MRLSLSLGEDALSPPKVSGLIAYVVARSRRLNPTKPTVRTPAQAASSKAGMVFSGAWWLRPR